MHDSLCAGIEEGGLLFTYCHMTEARFELLRFSLQPLLLTPGSSGRVRRTALGSVKSPRAVRQP